MDLATGSQVYSYDNLNRMTNYSTGTMNSSHGIASPTKSEGWNLDALGNWHSNSVTNSSGGTTTLNRVNNAQNQIASMNTSSGSGSVNLIYDADGNMLKDQNGQQYFYDAWNRLVTVKNSSSGTLAAYTYDGNDRQITVTESGSTTDLYYSNRWQVIEERASGSTTAATQYVWSPFYVDQMVERDTYSGSSSTRLYVEQDADFNVTSLSNASGGVVERYTYDPYGSVTVMNAAGTVLSGSAYGWIYLSQGLRLDAASGLYQDRFRPDKNPVLGRFDSEDPDGAINGPNEYQDQEGNPTDSLDPIGTESWYEGWGSATYILFGGNGYGSNATSQSWSYGWKRGNETVSQVLPLVPDAVVTVLGAAQAVATEGGDDTELNTALEELETDAERVGTTPLSVAPEPESPPSSSAPTAPAPEQPAAPATPSAPQSSQTPEPVEPVTPSKICPAPSCFAAGTQVMMVDDSVGSAEAGATGKAFCDDVAIFVLAFAPLGYVLLSVLERKRFLIQAGDELAKIEPLEMPLFHKSWQKWQKPIGVPPMALFCQILISTDY